MRRATLLTAAVLAALALNFVSGCSKVNRGNFDKVQNGMTVQQVQDLLGKPTETKSGGGAVLGVGGSASTMTWRSDNRSITVSFVNDKVVSKSMENL